MSIQPLSKLADLINNSNKFCGETKLICIDGPAGSGKTTLAKNLKNFLNNTSIIHMDEIYEGWENALNDNLVSNIQNWIITPMKKSEPIIYTKFDWYLKSRKDKVIIENYENIILEGVGAASLGIRELSVLNLWIEGRKEILLNRVLDRDGNQIKDEMKLWQSKESEYFLKHDIKKHCDFWIDGNFEQEIDTSSQFISLNR